MLTTVQKFCDLDHSVLWIVCFLPKVNCGKKLPRRRAVWMSVVEWVLAASSAGPTPDSDYAPPAYSSLGKIGPVVLVFVTRVGDSPPSFSEYNLLEQEILPIFVRLVFLYSRTERHATSRCN